MLEQAAFYICALCALASAVFCAAAKSPLAAARALAVFFGATAMLCALAGCPEAAAVLLLSGMACAGALSWSGSGEKKIANTAKPFTAALFTALALAGFSTIFVRGLSQEPAAATAAPASAANCMSGDFAPVLILLAAALFAAATAASFLLAPGEDK